MVQERNSHSGTSDSEGKQLLNDEIHELEEK
jgi:hypothetical protein